MNQLLFPLGCGTISPAEREATEVVLRAALSGDVGPNGGRTKHAVAAMHILIPAAVIGGYVALRIYLIKH